LGRKFETRTRTGTHTPCIQTSSTLFPFQAAFDLQASRHIQTQTGREM
jgi:hypothetical protein